MARGSWALAAALLWPLTLGHARRQTILSLDVEERGLDWGQSLYVVRGSSACWGVPGLALQADGTYNLVPAESNFACSSPPEYYEALIVGFRAGYWWDFLNWFETNLGQVKFMGLAESEDPENVPWAYYCRVLGDSPALTCQNPSDRSFKVTVHASSASRLRSVWAKMASVVSPASPASPTSPQLAQAGKATLTAVHEHRADGVASPSFAARSPSTVLKLEVAKQGKIEALAVAGGSAACWGSPGFSETGNGTYDLTPDESNQTCSGKKGDGYCNKFMATFITSSGPYSESAQVGFQGSGTLQANGSVTWTYSCQVLEPYSSSLPTPEVTCKQTSPLDFKVTVDWTPRSAGTCCPGDLAPEAPAGGSALQVEEVDVGAFMQTDIARGEL